MMDWLQLLLPAWIMGTLLVFLTAPLGCLMLWRRMSFFADTMAHGTLLGVAIAGAMSLPLWIGVTFIALLLVAILWVLYDPRLPNDALLALCSATLLCSGLLFIQHLPGLRPELLSYLFGDLLTISWNDLPTFEWSSVLDVTLVENTLLDENALIQVYAEKSPNQVSNKPEIVLSEKAKLEKLQGKTLTLPFTTALPQGFQALYLYKDQTATIVLKGNTHIFYAKQPRLVALKIKLRDEQVWSTIKNEVLHWNTTNTLDVLAFSRYFLSEHEVIQQAPNLTMKETMNLHEAMKKLNNTVFIYKRSIL